MPRVKSALKYISGVFHQHDPGYVSEPIYTRTEQQRASRYTAGALRQQRARDDLPHAETIQMPKGFKAYKAKVLSFRGEDWIPGRILKNGRVVQQGYRHRWTGEFMPLFKVNVPDMIYSLDRSMFGDATPYSDAFYRATDEQQKEIIRRAQEIDWDTFWKSQMLYDPRKGGLTQDGQVLLDWIFEGIEVMEIEATPLGTSSQLYSK